MDLPRSVYSVIFLELMYSLQYLFYFNVTSPKVNGLKEVYSPKLLEPTSPRCQVVLVYVTLHEFHSLLICNGVK